ncbi:hypothetical protein D3C81_1778160 [compost metagenome]
MPWIVGAAVHLQVGLGQQGDLGGFHVLDLVGRHFVLQPAIGQELDATGVDGVVIDGTFIDFGLRLVEKTFRADVPVADGRQQRGDHAVQGNVTDLFTEHVSLYR